MKKLPPKPIRKAFVAMFLMFQLAYYSAQGQIVNFEWAKSMGSLGSDYGKSIKIDPSGNIYTVGHFEGTVDFDPGAGTTNLTSAGGYDIFVSKLDPSGTFVWAKQIGGTSTIGDFGYSITTDTLGNIFIGGLFGGTVDFDPSVGVYNLISNGQYDGFILKLDTNGDIVWVQSLGGTSYDYLHDLETDVSGGVVATGSFAGVVDFDPGAGVFNLTASGYSEVFITKLDANGNFSWAKQIGGTGVSVESYSLDLDALGNIYITGVFDDTTDFDTGVDTFNLISNGQYEGFISKLDANGNLIWAKQLAGASSYGTSIVTDIGGNIYTTGIFKGVVDFDPSGNVFSLTSAFASKDVFISKLDALGNFVWAHKVGGFYDDYASSISLDALNNVYTTGYFGNTVDFDPGAGVFSLTSVNNGEDVFVSKLDVSGNFVWALSFGGIGSDQANEVRLDDVGNVYTIGVFGNTVDFDPSADTFDLTSAGSRDIFLHKMTQMATAIHELAIEGLSLYPNPTNGSVTLEIEQNFNSANIEVLNALGQVVWATQTSAAKSSFALPQEAGVYFVRVRMDGLNGVYKIVKE